MHSCQVGVFYSVQVNEPLGPTPSGKNCESVPIKFHLRVFVHLFAGVSVVFLELAALQALFDEVRTRLRELFV